MDLICICSKSSAAMWNLLPDLAGARAVSLGHEMRCDDALSRAVLRTHNCRMKSRRVKRIRNDRSWQHRSYRVCHFVHGLKESHGDEREARTPCKKMEPRRTG